MQINRLKEKTKYWVKFLFTLFLEGSVNVLIVTLSILCVSTILIYFTHELFYEAALVLLSLLGGGGGGVGW